MGRIRKQHRRVAIPRRLLVHRRTKTLILVDRSDTRQPADLWRRARSTKLMGAGHHARNQRHYCPRMSVRFIQY
jgi:hypothetical protein